MYKKIGAAVGLVMCAVPVVAAADVQSQIAELLAKVTALQSQLSLTQWTSPAALTAQASTAVGATSQGNCVDLARDLYRPLADAATGGEVSKLQRFLIAEKVLNAGAPTSNVTGNFGPLTEEAVQKWQYDHDVVREGNAETTGYGYVGKRTRALMSCGGSGSGSGSGSGTGTGARGDANLRVTPFAGPAPLTVGFYALKATTATEFSIDFGDGTSVSTLSPATCAPGSTSCGFSTNHTYTANGTYTAKLKKTSAGAPLIGGCDSEYCRIILGIANSSVTDIVAQATITVGPKTSGTTTTVPPTTTGVTNTTANTGPSAREQIQLLYLGYLGRSGDAAGVEYWSNQLKGGMSIAQIAQAIGLSDEAKKRNPYLEFPDAADPGVFIENVYQRLFDRAADADGKAYWLSTLTARKGNISAIANFILDVESGADATGRKTMMSKIPGAGTNADTSAGSIKTTGIIVKYTGGTLVGTASFDSNDCAAAGFKIDWGDSKTDTLVPTAGQCVNGATISGGPIGYGITHTYANVGTYVVKLFKGTSTTPLSSAVFIATR